jgi:predicted amidohydrolase
MRTALYKGPEQPGDVARNVELLSSMVHAAADRGARLLICSELFLTGYTISAAAGHRLAEPAGGLAARQVACASPDAEDDGAGALVTFCTPQNTR